MNDAHELMDEETAPARVAFLVLDTAPRRMMASTARDPIHWKCPTCFEPCRCTDPAARAMPHKPCNRPKEKTNG